LGQTDLGPEFVTRKLETSVTVPHGNTLLLGGIIDTTQTRSARKIPVLADIPGLGAAFQSKVHQDERNELLLAITPRIVNTPGEGQATMSRFMMAARGLQRAMYENADTLPEGMLDPTVRGPEAAVQTDAIPVTPDATPTTAPPPGLEQLPPEFRKELERRSDAASLEGQSADLGAWAFVGPPMLGPTMEPVAPALLMSW
jgi:Flp pilus assembly secretin CpaC